MEKTQTSNRKHLNVKTMIVLAMISAIAFALAAWVRFPVIPAVSFLRFDPKDIVIIIAGFIYGPLTTVIITVVVAILQFFITSATGWVGLLMNIVAGVAFCTTAAFIYSKRRSMSGAVIGLIVGTITLTIVMVLWNYILTPIFMGWPREAVVAILWTGIVPFNLFNGIVNSALVLLAYKPITNGLRAANLMPKIEEKSTNKRRINPAVIAIAIFVLISAVLWYMAQQGMFAPTPTPPYAG